jgi:hypothetical protein
MTYSFRTDPASAHWRRWLGIKKLLPIEIIEIADARGNSEALEICTVYARFLAGQRFDGCTDNPLAARL